MEMSAELLFVLGLASSGIVWLLKLLFVNKDKEIPVWVYSIVLGIVALGLALLFAPITFPPFPPHAGDLLSFLGALLAYAGAILPALMAVIGFARIIYEALLKRILEGLEKRLNKALGSDIG